MLKVLRDPIWQMIGVVVSVVIAVLATAQTSGSSFLYAVHVRQGKAIDSWLPGKRIQLLLEGTPLPSERTIVDYFLLINDSSKPILAESFSGQIDVEAADGTKQITAVESCSSSYARACSVDGRSTPQGGRTFRRIGSEGTRFGPLRDRC